MSRPRYVGLPHQFRPLTRQAAVGSGADFGSLIEVQTADCDPADIMCLLQDCLEYRREIAGRTVDHLQNLGGRGLLFQGFAGLVDQPGVFHRDHRLGREVLQQRDLLVREWPHFLPENREEAQKRVIFAQCYVQHRARPERDRIRSAKCWTASPRNSLPVLTVKPPRTKSSSRADMPRVATAWACSPSSRKSPPKAASHNVIARWRIASNTGVS